jgi:hypothetical protein
LVAIAIFPVAASRLPGGGQDETPLMVSSLRGVWLVGDGWNVHGTREESFWCADRLPRSTGRRDGFEQSGWLATLEGHVGAGAQVWDVGWGHGDQAA